MDSFQASGQDVHFYVDYGYDSAVLGFIVKHPEKHPRYFPMYFSTYRGLPQVTLKVFLSDSLEEMWVHSSWTGYEVLAYHRIGSDRYVTQYGDNSFINTPMPSVFGGGSMAFPDMNPARVKKILTISYRPP